MKAIRFHEYGGPDVLRYEDAPKPEPGPGELLIRVKATAVNPVDVAIRAGYLRAMRDVAKPFILGWDFSGVVEACGEGTTKFQRGDEVFGLKELWRQGNYAQFTAVPENVCAAKPTGLDHATAAAIPLAGLTAWQALFDHAGLQSGQKVLIHAGAGGVGHFAIQFAKAKGITVAATASTHNQEFLSQLGADQPIDYTATKFEDVVTDADAVIESKGGDVRDRSWKTLKPGGILVALIGPPPSEDDAAAHKVRQTLMWVHPDADQLAEIAELVAAGKVKVHIDQTYPLTEVAKAHAASATGHTRGKLVITVD